MALKVLPLRKNKLATCRREKNPQKTDFTKRSRAVLRPGSAASV